MAYRLRLQRRPGQPDRLRVLGHARRGLYLVEGHEGVLRWRSDRPVNWRTFWKVRKTEVMVIDEIVEALGLTWARTGEWQRAMEMAETPRAGSRAAA